MTEDPKKDPQHDILAGHGAFGVEYVPKSKRAPVVEGRVFAGKMADFPPGKGKAISLDRFSIAVFRIDDEFYAIKDACPHADYPLSKSLMTSRYVVMCSSHNWSFDIRDGHCTKMGRCGGHSVQDLSVRCFPVEKVGEEVWVRVETTQDNI